MKHLLVTTIVVEAGGPRVTPRTTNFKIGIPFVYAFEVCVRTVRDPEPNTPAAGENNPFADPDDYELGGATLAAPANQVTRRRVVRTVD